MALDPPKPGQVINYAYLWSHEHRAQRDEGRKIRPVAVVYTNEKAGRTRAYVLPMSRSAPHGDQAGIEVPEQVKSHLGLDARRSWIITSELNHFQWPGADIHKRSTAEVSRGSLPYDMTDRLQRIIREHVRAKSLAHVDRDIDVLEKIDMVRQARMTGYRVSAQASAADDARRQGLIWQQQNRGHDGQRSPAQTVNVRNPKNASSASRDRGLGR